MNIVVISVAKIRLQLGSAWHQNKLVPFTEAIENVKFLHEHIFKHMNRQWEINNTKKWKK